MKKVKRILAILGVVLLLSLYVMSFVSSIFAKPYANGLFIASLYCTIAVPILMYGFMVVYKAVHKKEEGISIKELKKKNKKYK